MGSSSQGGLLKAEGKARHESPKEGGRGRGWVGEGSPGQAPRESSGRSILREGPGSYTGRCLGVIPLTGFIVNIHGT